MLQNLYDKMVEYGKYTRSNKISGLAQWNKVKPFLSKCGEVCEWKDDVKSYFVDMRSTLKIQECENEIKADDDKKRHDLWEKYHFYLQHSKIPTLNFTEGTLTRLMQIAYNAGQLEAEWNDKIYTNELKKYYTENNLKNMDTYMNKANLKKLENSLTDEIIENLEKIFGEMNEMKGGASDYYKQKYLKYKQKYLQSGKIMN